MKFSFKAFLVLTTIFFLSFEEFGIQQAEAGVVVRRRIRSRYRTRTRKNTAALRATLGSIGGKTFGTKKTIGKVYAARLKEYKIALKMWQKEKKIAAKLQKDYARLKEKQLKQEAKARADIARRIAKEKERQKVEIAEAEQEAALEPQKSSGDEDKKKDKSIFSKLTKKTEDSKSGNTERKTQFKKSKLKFMSRLFLSLFGKEQ